MMKREILQLEVAGLDDKEGNRTISEKEQSAKHTNVTTAGATTARPSNLNNTRV